jgi:hypothetical protein
MPATGADWRSCWLAGTKAASSAFGASGSAGPVRIAVRNGGTYVVGVGAWATPKQEQPCSAGRRPAPEENPWEEDQEAAEEDLLFSPLEEDPPEEDRTFKPADSLHFQNGHGSR